ncbi:MAG TPA: STAS domain-containing protein [Candidatus Udaeobacter sp.]|jgi:anti-anti-sigma factor|nr:STAS domain-containing protein [Candidatus Udaeobacter sp.]
MNKEVKFSRVERPGTIVLRVYGPLDASTSPRFLDECGDIQSLGKNLVINLAEVPFIASSGIGAIMAVADAYHEGQLNSVRLAAVSPAVSMVVDLLSLHEFLEIDDNEDDACSKLKAA